MATLQDVKNAYTLGKEESDQLKIANNRFRNWNPHGSINEDGDAYRNYKAPPKVPGELPNKYRGPVFGVEDESGQMFFDFVKQLQINPEIAGALLPGETPAGGKGGLGSMNKDQLERWIKENGITGTGADKIRNKWKNLGPNLPLADASALSNYLKAIGQDQRSGSMRDSPLKGQELIDALKIGVEKFKA